MIRPVKKPARKKRAPRAWNSTLPLASKRSETPQQSTKLARRKKRKPSETLRIYGSKARVAWIKAHSCSVPFCSVTPCDNAHIRNGGMGRKADAKWIIPLCRGHHRELHDTGKIAVRDWLLGQVMVLRQGNLDSIARSVDAAWQLRLSSEAA